MTDSDNRKYITSAKSINEVGHTILAFLILQAKHILHKWALYNNLFDKMSLSTSNSGYSNKNLAMYWLRHFDKHSTKRQVRLYCLFIMDGYGLHLTYEFWSYAIEHKIILFRLPSHSTYLIQPLNIGCFQPFKHYHTQAIDCVVRLGDVEFDKLQFMAEFLTIEEKTLIKTIICNAWKKTGLIPFNPKIILSKIWKYQNI